MWPAPPSHCPKTEKIQLLELNGSIPEQTSSLRFAGEVTSEACIDLPCWQARGVIPSCVYWIKVFCLCNFLHLCLKEDQMKASYSEGRIKILPNIETENTNLCGEQATEEETVHWAKVNVGLIFSFTQASKLKQKQKGWWDDSVHGVLISQEQGPKFKARTHLKSWVCRHVVVILLKMT